MAISAGADADLEAAACGPGDSAELDFTGAAFMPVDSMVAVSVAVDFMAAVFMVEWDSTGAEVSMGADAWLNNSELPERFAS